MIYITYYLYWKIGLFLCPKRDTLGAIYRVIFWFPIHCELGHPAVGVPCGTYGSAIHRTHHATSWPQRGKPEPYFPLFSYFPETTSKDIEENILLMDLIDQNEAKTGQKLKPKGKPEIPHENSPCTTRCTVFSAWMLYRYDGRRINA